MIRYCADRGIRETILNTNAMLLRGEMRGGVWPRAGWASCASRSTAARAAEMEYLRDGSILERVLREHGAPSPRAPRIPDELLRRAQPPQLRSRVPTSCTSPPEAGVRRIYCVETVPFRDELHGAGDLRPAGVSVRILAPHGSQRQTLARIHRAGAAPRGRRRHRSEVVPHALLRAVPASSTSTSRAT